MLLIQTGLKCYIPYSSEIEIMIAWKLSQGLIARKPAFEAPNEVKLKPVCSDTEIS